jgi:hypothetical protein
VLLEETAFGLTWVLGEPASRTSHALVDSDRVWLIDPTDEPVPLERALARRRPAAAAAARAASSSPP